MYGVKRTTIYLPEDLKAELERLAKAEGRTEADLMREGIQGLVDERTRPRPSFPLFDSGGALDASRVDELLAGDPERGIPAFGED
jgi:hypothetical protein